LNDLRVLASYLASRARSQHVVLDKPTLRALTLAVYTDRAAAPTPPLGLTRWRRGARTLEPGGDVQPE